MKLNRNLRRDFFLSGIASHSSRVNMPLYFGFEVAQVSRHSLVGRVHLVQLLRPMECACGEGIILTLLQDVNPWTNGRMEGRTHLTDGRIQGQTHTK